VADSLEFPVEEIPDADSVFMRAHKDHFRDGTLRHSVFRAQDGGMSVNWDKYCSKEETKQQAKIPAVNAVISLPVGGIRKIRDLNVKHTPEPRNRAHSEVNLPDNREDLTEVRVLLLRLADIVLAWGQS
jgi:hypothetical protein